MGTQALIAQMRAQRKQWVEIEPGKKVAFLRPPETEFGQVREMSVELLRKYVCDWEGFTEVDLLGAGVGGSSPLPWDIELWAELFTDRIEWSTKVANSLVASVKEHMAAKDAAGKNS